MIEHYDSRSDPHAFEDWSVADGNVLTGSVFDMLPHFAGPKGFYAAASRMGARAAREGITFKQTPCVLEV